MIPAVFLDRDDTLIACNSVVPDGDLGDPALVALLPGAREACEALRAAGFRLFVVSNQGGVARGKFGVDAVQRVNARVNELLGGAIHAFYFCPWHPRGVVPEFAREHPWRKPAAGMLLAAAQDHGLDLARSWLIGDAERDVQAGAVAACRTVLLAHAPSAGSVATFTARDLPGAASIVLRESGA